MVDSPASFAANELAVRLMCTSVSCVVADSLCLPMDTIKVRLQLQNELLPLSSARLSFLDMSLKMVRMEGVFSFWAGLGPAMARQAVYGGLSYFAYPLIRDELQSRTGYRGFAIQVLSGGIAGGVAAAIANPTDVIKVRLQADGRRVLAGLPRIYPQSAIATFQSVLKKEGGLFSLYAGLGPNVSRATVVNAVGMSSYDKSKSIVEKFVPSDRPLLQRFCAALVGGVASTIAGCPFDLIKTRLMARSKSDQIFTSPLHCLLSTLRSEGPLALWKGALPVYGRQAPFNLLNYLILESLLDLFSR